MSQARECFGAGGLSLLLRRWALDLKMLAPFYLGQEDCDEFKMKPVKIILHSLFIIYGLWIIWSNGIRYPYLVWGDLMQQSYSKVYVILMYIFSMPLLLFTLLRYAFIASMMLKSTENDKVGKRFLWVSIGLLLQSILPPLTAFSWNFINFGVIPTILSFFKIKVF